MLTLQEFGFLCEKGLGDVIDATMLVAVWYAYSKGLPETTSDGRYTEERMEVERQEITNETVEGGNSSVYNRITGTDGNMPSTEIPTTFKLELSENIKYVNPETGTNTLWTNSNATKHMGEYISRFGDESWSIGVRSQAMLESYEASINQAMETLSSQNAGRYFGTYGNWELGINTETGVVYHARMLY